MSSQDASPSRSEGLSHLAPIIYLVDDDASLLRALSRRLEASNNPG
jgi:hypothetical protein